MLALAGCGGGGGSETRSTDTGEHLGTATTDDQLRFPRPSTVGDGTSTSVPPIAAAVSRAAAAAGCTVRGFPSEGRGHTEDPPAYKVSNPPTSGPHNPVWANWGVYDTPVPVQYLVHNLEHGGVEIYLGRSVPAATRDAVLALWRSSPPFMMVVPGATQGFPPGAVVATSWQRWLVCRAPGPKTIAALTAFRDAYRGTGPEGAAALNAPSDAVDGQEDLPKPSEPDTGATSG